MIKFYFLLEMYTSAKLVQVMRILEEEYLSLEGYITYQHVITI